MKTTKSLNLLLLATTALLLSACDDTITMEVTGNQATVVEVNTGRDMTHGKVLVAPRNGKVRFDFATDRITYIPQGGFYGLDYVSLQAGTRKCVLFMCWIEWQPLKANILVGPGPAAGLRNIVATSRTNRIGTAVNPSLLASSAQYGAVVAREFNTMTLENEHKWSFLSQAPGVYDFSAADAAMKFAQNHGIAVKGHAALWYAADPGYVTAAEGNPTLLRQIINDHIRTLLGHYDSDCRLPSAKYCIKDWDVVNEASASPSFIENAAAGDGGFRDNVYFRTLGTSYVGDAFHAARQAAPGATLWINDYNVEMASIKSDNFYRILREMTANGVPVDGVGLQSHVIFDHSPVELLNNMKRFAGLGLKVNISELDVPAITLTGAVDSLYEIMVVQKRAPAFFDLLAMPAMGRTHEDQLIYYQNYATACAMVNACDWVTQWGVADNQSWLKPQAKALTFYDTYQRKPTYFALAQGMTQNGRLTEPENKPVAVDPGVALGTLIEWAARAGL